MNWDKKQGFGRSKRKCLKFKAYKSSQNWKDFLKNVTWSKAARFGSAVALSFLLISCTEKTAEATVPTVSRATETAEISTTDVGNLSEEEVNEIEDSWETPDLEDTGATGIPEESTEEMDTTVIEELEVSNAFTEEEFNKFLPYSIQYYVNRYRTDGEPFLTLLVDPSTGTSIRRSYVAPYVLQNGEFASGLESHIWNDPDADRMIDAYSEQYVMYVNGERTRDWDPNGEYNQFFLLMKAEDDYGEYNYVVPLEGGFFRFQSKPTYAPTNKVDGVPTKRVQYIPLSEIGTLTPQERKWYDSGYMVADYRYHTGIPRGPWFALKGIDESPQPTE